MGRVPRTFVATRSWRTPLRRNDERHPHPASDPFCPLVPCTASEPARTDYWPTTEWQSANVSAQLVRLRTSHPALSVNSINFFHVDFEEGKRVVAWRRGSDNDPVIVVANFSDFTTPHALEPGAEYFVRNWPPTPVGSHWFEVTQGRHLRTGRHEREAMFAWEAKVYRLVPGDNF